LKNQLGVLDDKQRVLSGENTTSTRPDPEMSMKIFSSFPKDIMPITQINAVDKRLLSPEQLSGRRQDLLKRSTMSRKAWKPAKRPRKYSEFLPKISKI
jgi:hypothetical protein